MRKGISAFLSILLLAATLQAQDKKLKVYISADMEGIGGVSTWQVQAAPGAPEYEKFRRLMTLEVNSAISGAFDAGATEVLVSDSHWNAQNIDIEGSTLLFSSATTPARERPRRFSRTP